MDYQGIEDPGSTGNFNVFLNGVLVHAKKGGQGKTETEAEKEQIKVRIRRLMQRE